MTSEMTAHDPISVERAIALAAEIADPGFIRRYAEMKDALASVAEWLHNGPGDILEVFGERDARKIGDILRDLTHEE